MPRILKSYKGTSFTISDKPINSGGEGAIHEVVGGKAGIVAKIYHTPQKAQDFYPKILFMVNNPPFGNAPKQIRDAIIWPIDILFENDVFVGYIMPLVNGGIKLFEVTLPAPPGHNHGPQWQKFNHSNPDAFLIRMKVCYNLAKAIEVLHQSGNYALVDLKPENVLIKPNGHFSIIDLDSIQITDKHQLLFPSTAHTPEYSPQEFHNGKIDPQSTSVAQSFDNFSLAVILYQVLLGIHPFQASHARLTTIADNIKHGLFAHGAKKKQLHIIPHPHKAFKSLSDSTRKLFIRALDHGHINPDFRPTAEEWVKVLISEINSFEPGTINNNWKKHCFYNSKPKTRANNSVAPKKAITQLKSSPPWQRKVSSSVTFNPGNRPHQGLTASHKVTNRPRRRFLQQNAKRKLKWIAPIFLLMAVGYMISDIMGFDLKSLPIWNQTHDKQIISHTVDGKYFGFIETNHGIRQVSYLRLQQLPESTKSYALQIINNVASDPIFENIEINSQNRFTSRSLGEGVFKINNYGKISLLSTEENSITWYFEK